MRTIERTDERMYDLAKRMDAGFARVDADIRDLRAEMHSGFQDVRAEMRAGLESMRSETRHGLAMVHAEVAELRSIMFRFGIAMIATMIALIATLMAAIVTGSFTS